MPIRILQPGDEPRLEAFLSPRADTSMLLRSNLQQGGIVDRGQSHQGTWAASFEGGAITGVVQHSWLDSVVLQTPLLDEAADLVRAAARACGRKLRGLVGPRAQVVAAREGLGLSSRETNIDEAEVLFTLELRELRVPPALQAGQLTCRHSEDADLELLVRWRTAYAVETGLERPGAQAEAKSRQLVELSHGLRQLWLLEDRGQPVAMTAYNSRLRRADGGLEMVQVGGVYTLPELRGRGYARCAVAGQLAQSRDAGATRAVLFTGQGQKAAQAAYRSLGFRQSGDYGMTFFRDPPAL